MAIDTENKRRSVHAYAGAIVYPRPDGAIGATDRAHASWMYARAGAAPPSTTTKYYGCHAKRQGPQRFVISS